MYSSRVRTKLEGDALMGWGQYKLTDGRWGGYDVEATCDGLGCDKIIDRGLAFCCGDPLVDGRDTSSGCGKYFCSACAENHNTGDNPGVCMEGRHPGKRCVDAAGNTISFRFEVEFLKYPEPIGRCDFCETNPMIYYCERLVTGYCEDCMAEVFADDHVLEVSK